VKHRLEVTAGVALAERPEEGHNRWHPEVPPRLTVAPGDEVMLDLRDGFDGQLDVTSDAADVSRLELYRGHPMTGPIAVEGAEPGDLLEVDVLEVSPAATGYSVVIPGAGALGHRLPGPFIAHWRLAEADGRARSEQLPGVAMPGRPFLGVIGVAPAAASVTAATVRERELAAAGHTVALPDPRGAVPAGGPPASAGLATLPPRRNGGNLDLKQLTAGSRVSFAVEVPGGLLSAGDPHFCQGDGESGGTAIEMRARARLRIGLRKAGDLTWHPRHPVVSYTAAGEPRGACIVTTGTPSGPGYLDLHEAAVVALEEMHDYLTAVHGFGVGAAAVLISVAVDLRVSEIVNVPNPLVSAVLPLDVFEGPDGPG
jgi:formamidase